MKKISLVVPIYNEEESLPILIPTLIPVLKSLDSNYLFEIIFVNDGSSDNSWQLISEYVKNYSFVKGINFSRNFGHQAALKAGYDHVSGEAVITIDADLQDPPTLIPELIKMWEKGYYIVYARRKGRTDTFLKKVTAYWYYIFLDYIADVAIPRNVGDYRLIDSKVVEIFKNSKEHSLYLRGFAAWTGFKHAFVDFKRDDRVGGQTGYSWAKMFRLAFDGVTSFSLFPLRLAGYTGVFVILSGVAMFLYITVDALFFNVYYPLFKWLVTILYIFMGVQFILLWLIGEYIGRIYEQQKGRPLYIVADKKG